MSEPKANIYYLTTLYSYNEETKKSSYKTWFTDIGNRKRKEYTLKDFTNSHRYLIGSYNGNFQRIYKITNIKHFMFFPCPWKDTIKDQYAKIWWSEKTYQRDYQNVLDEIAKAKKIYGEYNKTNNQTLLYRTCINSYDLLHDSEEKLIKDNIVSDEQIYGYDIDNFFYATKKLKKKPAVYAEWELYYELHKHDGNL